MSIILYHAFYSVQYILLLSGSFLGVSHILIKSILKIKNVSKSKIYVSMYLVSRFWGVIWWKKKVDKIIPIVTLYINLNIVILKDWLMQIIFIPRFFYRANSLLPSFLPIILHFHFPLYKITKVFEEQILYIIEPLYKS